MLASLSREIIRKKRDGQELSQSDINSFVSGIVSGHVSDSQIAAFCMAVFLNRFNLDECVLLTQAMAHSGQVINWQEEGINAPVIDKHSTGGVGDKVSLILAPILAACEVYVPMISGRGLGHTGGTLDKMTAIPGYNVQPSLSDFKAIVKQVGCAIIGQTGDIAPADKRIYAVRDVTATVSTKDLITPSILSKKMAAGLTGLVMDVKWGNGAFMQTVDEAIELAKAIGKVANNGGLPTTAVITDMNQVLGHSAGNAVEVRESIEFLTGTYRDSRLLEITIALCSHMLLLSNPNLSPAEAEKTVRITLDNGKAAEKFATMVKALGGPGDIMDNYDTYLPKAAIIKPVLAPADGFITGMKTRDIGLAVIELGGGRIRSEDEIDYAVGISHILPLGTAVKKSDPLLTLHAKNDEDWQAINTTLLSCIAIGENPVDIAPVVHSVLLPDTL